MTTAIIKPLVHGLMADFSDQDFPSKVYGYNRMSDRPGEKQILLVEELEHATAFGFVESGSLCLDTGDTQVVVPAGHYFCQPYRIMIASGAARAFFASRLNYVGLPMVGGKVESRGRLKYIDGCSDSLLIGPPLKGDPCFNLLHFPPGIDQTKHTHPSIRAGLIHSGSGACHTAEGTEPLNPGDMFILFPDAIHAFSTVGTDGMTLTVFHPETDFGPTHEDHPMLNKTIVDGVSAKHLDDIRTKEIG
jgi:quercetin dioxygenase-like cupin family protein